MKKLLSFVAVILCALTLVFAVGCGEEKGPEGQEGFKPVAKEDIKIGLITLHDETSTYDANFINSMKAALKNLGIPESQLELCTGIGENEQCYTKATELAQTCDVIFADSFDHESFMIQAAKENPTVRFCHATGDQAHTEKLDNFSNAFADIYQGRYLAGIAAGMKLNELNAGKEEAEQNFKVGYVGAYPYAEVVSGYTSFFLGVRSVAPKATMEVRYTSSWYDFDKEQAACQALIAAGCALISQHADSMGAPQACEAAGVPNVTYNGSTNAQCPNTYIVSSKIDWAPYFEYMINQTIEGEKIDTDWCGTLENGAVKLDAVGASAAEGTQAAIDAAAAQLKAGTLHVFDCDTFTVGGVKATEGSELAYANVNRDAKYEKDTYVVSDGYFKESFYRSAPYFELRIDGITEISDK